MGAMALRTDRLAPLAALALAASFALPARAQDAAEPEEAPTPPPAVQPKFNLEDLPAPVALGVRVRAIREHIPTRDVLVLVPDASAYLDAVSLWSLNGRFPVLIDDGSDRSRERIARFVRAFRPGRVLRWDGADVMWAQSLKVLEGRITGAVASAWGAETSADLPARWETLGVKPLGAVFASANDPAWTAAVALAAAHGQLLLWLPGHEPAGSLGATLDDVEFASLRGRIDVALQSTGLAYNRVGDELDALTLCLNLPSKVRSDAGPLALTDTIGRPDSGGKWAWTGLIPGDGAQAAYMAMCSIFLSPDEAWLFDGYPNTQQFFPYSAATAASALRERGWQVLLDREPANDRASWRSRARIGVGATLIHVNSSGQRRWFRLMRENTDSADLPDLRRPAMVHFIHSFSAQNLDDPTSLGARWLEHGAYAYVGSVDEPFLSAFVPPATMVRRLSVAMPFAPSTTAEAGRAWKVLYLGDPLAIAGPVSERIPEPPELPGATNIEESMRAAAEQKDLAATVEALVLLGREDDALALTRAAIAQTPDAITPRFAQVMLRPAIRTGDARLITALHARTPKQTREDPVVADMLWLALRPALEGQRVDASALRVLREHERRRLIEDDAADIARAIRRTDGPAAARAYLMETASLIDSERVRKKVLDLAGQY